MNSQSRNNVTHPNRTTAERRSDHELAITRSFDATAHSLFEAWTTPELLKQWWAPKSSGMSLLSCEVDARPGGSYRFEFGGEGPERIAFFGKYLEASAPTRLVWTNEESDEDSITTVTFTETGGQTRLVMHECYSSPAALDAAFSGMADGMSETFAQLDEILMSRALPINR